jgi:glycosyltransferase involved in cell wall biosynthesis
MRVTSGDDIDRFSVSVVVPVRNGQSTIAQQLAALQAQSWPIAGEIIVVDNGSTDDTAAVATSFATGPVPLRVVFEPVPGVNRARNAGVAASDSTFVLLCDADDAVEPGWVSGLIDGLRRAELVGGLVETASLNDRESQQMWGVADIVRPQGLGGFASPWGCNCGFRRDVWLDLGGFDAELSGAADEVEFFVRAQVAGKSLEFVDSAVVRYRLRAQPSSVLRRRYQNGLGEALLRSRFALPYASFGGFKRAAKSWLWLATRAPKAAIDAEFRWTWSLLLYRRVGRLVGSLKYHVVCL